jgi:hypothetical protein
MLHKVAPEDYILRERHYIDNQYGIKTQLLAYLLAPLCSSFVLSTSYLNSPKKIACMIAVHAPVGPTLPKNWGLLKSRKYWSCYNATWLIGSIVAPPL